MRNLLMAALVGAVLSIASSAVAAASCVAPPGVNPGGTSLLDGSPVAFVGTVLSTSNADRVARVRVESVWKGRSVATVVTISGTPDLGSAATSVDRTFTPGVRYLFLPSNSSSPFQDNSCSATQLYTPSLDSLRPLGAQPPLPGTDGLEQAGPPLWVWPAAVTAITVGVVLGAWVVVRRRRVRQ